MTTLPAQEALFRLLRDRLEPEQSLVDVIAETLHVSADSAYRRIRCETPLVLEEAIRLCQAFRLSADSLFSLDAPPLLFSDIRMLTGPRHYSDFLSGLTAAISRLESLQEKDVIYLTKDLPLFHNFYFEPLAAFRYYFWMKNILELPDFADKGFSFSLLPEKIRDEGEALVKAYTRIPSAEIWNTECVNSTISQIEYCRDAGLFSAAADIRMVYEALEATLHHLERQTELGIKYFPGAEPAEENRPATNFRVFYNRIVLADNSVLVVTEKFSRVYLNYDALNYIHTGDPEFCRQQSIYLAKMMRKATLISQTGERQRNIFFNILRSKVRDRMQKL